MKALVFACVALLPLPVLAGSPAAAADQPVVTEAWISEAPPVAKNNAAYAVVENGSRRDALVAVETPAAARAELHQMSVAGGLMRMQRLPLINLAPRQKLAFGPGARHIMLIDMKQPLKAGDTVPLTLVFRKAGRITVEAVVRPLQVDDRSEPGDADSHSHAHQH